MDNLTVVDHPLLKQGLTALRERGTPHDQFRDTISDVSTMLAYEAMRDLKTATTSVDTPVESGAEGHIVTDEVIIIPILRAGLGMVDGFVRLVPKARIGHLGMERDELTKEPVDYYSNIPGGLATARVFVVDPMLATGGSARLAIDNLKQRGARRFTFVCVVAAPEGVRALSSAHPSVSIVAGTLDRELDDNAFIRPGLGDAGDRTFGT